MAIKFRECLQNVPAGRESAKIEAMKQRSLSESGFERKTKRKRKLYDS
jgi:hypothetical protein